MKKMLYLIALLLALPVGAQKKLSASEWQQDLRFLQTTVHNEYPFLFKKTTAEAFDAEVEKLYKAIPSMERHEIIVGLARIVSMFQYGHTALGILRSPAEFHQLPVNVYQFSDGVYIQGVHKDYKKALGAKIIAIEGMPVEKAMQAIYPVTFAENDQFFKAYGLRYLGVPEVLHARGVMKSLKNTVTFTLERNGKQFKQEITAMKELQPPARYGFIQQEGDWLDARNEGEEPLYLKNLDKLYYFQYLPEAKTVYVRQSQVQDDPAEDIPAFYQRVFEFVEKNDVERLIIDVRLNGGGNNYKNKPVIRGIVGSGKIDQPGKLFVILGRRTFSACQNLVNEMSNYTNAIFVGEPTAENINFYGDNRQVELPNSKLPAYLSYAWWQDKPQWENAPWLAPHVAVEMSFEDYRTNKDPVLEAALNFKDAQFVLDPMAHLTGLFMAGKYEEVKREARKLVEDPRYRFADFEDQFNRAGYRLMQQNQLKEALFVFELNTGLYPNSANAWDSLGEVYMKSGNKAKAIEYYQKALRMDPDGPTGKNAREMLKKIQAD